MIGSVKSIMRSSDSFRARFTVSNVVLPAEHRLGKPVPSTKFVFPCSGSRAVSRSRYGEGSAYRVAPGTTIQGRCDGAGSEEIGTPKPLRVSRVGLSRQRVSLGCRFFW